MLTSGRRGRTMTVGIPVESMKLLRVLCIWIIVGVVAGPAVAAAQRLADVARAEEARRKAAPKAAKVYTNQDLRPDQRPAQPVPATPAGFPLATATPAEPTAPEPEPDPPKDEEYWRARITAPREQLQRSRLFAEALQSRINALTTDFVNRDDPAQRAVIADDRQTALAELDRVEGEIREISQTIADIEEEARRAGVPPGWLR